MLTGKQRIALTLRANGLQEDAAAHQLGIATSTLKLRLQNARKVLGAANIIHAVAIATATGQIEVKTEKETT